MIEKHSDSPSGFKVHVPRSAKENYVVISPPSNYAPKSPSKFIKASCISTTQQWSTSSGMRVISPNVMSNTLSQSHLKRPEIIQLGGKRQKGNSSHKDGSVDQNRRLESLNNGLIHKISMLQGRIRELHRQKQQTTFEFNERIKKMQFQNDRLNALVHNYEQELSQSKLKLEKKEDIKEFDQLTLSEMLSNQININLQLREQSERLNEQVKQLNERSCELEQLLKQSQIQKKKIVQSHHNSNLKWQRQIQESQQIQQTLEAKVIELQQLRANRQSAIEQMIRQKEQRILGLQEELYTQSTSSQQKQKEVHELSEELTSVRLQNSQLKEQLQCLQNKNYQLQKQQCKKCKDLLHTVFRLNCQLNKK